MGKSAYTFGKNAKEKAKRLKQIEKAAKRYASRKQKAAEEAGAPGNDSAVVE